jgi:hypothetical protein
MGQFEYQDRVFHDLPYQRVQVDEIWSFVYAKAKNVARAKAAPEGAGDVWTWTAIDADTKLIPSWYVGSRATVTARHFIGDRRRYRLRHAGEALRRTGWRSRPIQSR